jgi:hypothetical protein
MLMTVIRKGSLSKTFLAAVSLVAATSFAAETTTSKASGLRGITSSRVMSGVPGGPTTGGPTSVEFAIAPVQGDRPAYQNAIFVKSDKQGKYEVALPPGRYWIGSKAKALNPVNYRPSAVVFSEKEAVVKEGLFTQLDLVEIGYAP